MLLVNIHLMQGKPVEIRRKVGELVYQTMMDTINVPRHLQTNEDVALSFSVGQGFATIFINMNIHRRYTWR
jgi:hypothetical protein